MLEAHLEGSPQGFSFDARAPVCVCMSWSSAEELVRSSQYYFFAHLMFWLVYWAFFPLLFGMVVWLTTFFGLAYNHRIPKMEYSLDLTADLPWVWSLRFCCVKWLVCGQLWGCGFQRCELLSVGRWLLFTGWICFGCEQWHLGANTNSQVWVRYLRYNLRRHFFKLYT